MNNLENLKRFVFNGILTEQSLADLQEKGISINTSEKLVPITRINEADFSPLIINNASKMASVYIAFFCLENAVRDLIQERLSERKGSFMVAKLYSCKDSRSCKKIERERISKQVSC
jgi:hypothetical protein